MEDSVNEHICQYDYEHLNFLALCVMVTHVSVTLFKLTL